MLPLVSMFRPEIANLVTSSEGAAGDAGFMWTTCPQLMCTCACPRVRT